MRVHKRPAPAIRSLFRYAALSHPEHAEVIQRVLAIPPKRFERRVVCFFTDAEVNAVLAAPDRTTWTGQRDHTLFATAVQTGLRVSELIGLRITDVHLGVGPHISCFGKGRKQRITPLTTSAVAVLRSWLGERDTQLGILSLQHGLDGCSAATHSSTGSQHVLRNSSKCPSLIEKRVTLHVLRHTAAMRLLRAGVDLSIIALWLGHEQIETTQIYLHADLALKEKALLRTTPVNTNPGRYRPPDALLKFLEAL